MGLGRKKRAAVPAGNVAKAGSGSFPETVEGLRGKYLRTLRANASAIHSGEDDDAVHDVRVACRRLLVLLKFLPGWRPEKARRQARQALRRLRRGLGPLREWAVHGETLNRLHGEADSDIERASLEHAQELVEARISCEHRRLRESLGGEAMSRVERRVDALHWRPSSRLTELEILRRLEDSAIALATRTLSAPPRSGQAPDVDRIHELRLCVKRLRYLIELIEAISAQPLTDLVAHTRALQEELGAYNDLAQVDGVLEPLVTRLCHHGRDLLAEGLAKSLRRIRQERAEHRACVDELLQAIPGDSFVHRLRAAWMHDREWIPALA